DRRRRGPFRQAGRCRPDRAHVARPDRAGPALALDPAAGAALDPRPRHQRGGGGRPVRHHRLRDHVLCGDRRAPAPARGRSRRATQRRRQRGAALAGIGRAGRGFPAHPCRGASRQRCRAQFLQRARLPRAHHPARHVQRRAGRHPAGEVAAGWCAGV
ncbi:MAG: hypothetical protein AVDCRST_MAG51-2725, partial [uncultured Ramlibacter sp.]